MSTLDMALRETQTQFYALKTEGEDLEFSTNDAFNLHKLSIKEVDQAGALKYLASTYDPYDQVIRDGYYEGGRKVISFVNILEHEKYPLASLLDFMLKKGSKEMARPIEIEFAVNLNEQNGEHVFYLLQIRPIVENLANLNEDLTLIPSEQRLIFSTNALGHGIINHLQDVVYVKSERFSAANNRLIGYDIEKINKQFLEEGKNYILVGPGRWGSSDEWLGIPVKWPNISAARVIVESALNTYQVDPSQGTHFFQNLTSFGVGYFTVNPQTDQGTFNEAYLDALPAETETEFVRHIHFSSPLVVKIDGKKNIGVVMMPQA